MMRGEGGVGESSSRARAKTQRGKENSEIFMRDMQENRKSQAHDACVWEWEKKKKSIILIRGLAAERLYIKHLLSAASVTARCWFPYTRASILCSTGRHLHQNRGVRGGWEYIKPSSVVWSCALYEAVQICVCVCVCRSVSRPKADQNRRRVGANVWKRSTLHNLFLLKNRAGGVGLITRITQVSHKPCRALPSRGLQCALLHPQTWCCFLWVQRGSDHTENQATLSQWLSVRVVHYEKLWPNHSCQCLRRSRGSALIL